MAPDRDKSAFDGLIRVHSGQYHFAIHKYFYIQAYQAPEQAQRMRMCLDAEFLSGPRLPLD
jgi:hypothetical protein